MRPCKANLSHAYLIQADFVNTQCQGANFRDAKFNKKTKLQSGGEINKEAIKAIEDAQLYLDNYWYEKMQQIIEENGSKHGIKMHGLRHAYAQDNRIGTKK
jgi:uncharacterized protein YjbI with pentapeptide repeats